jgi:mono/diheme cytochrome c family protein
MRTGHRANAANVHETQGACLSRRVSSRQIRTMKKRLLIAMISAFSALPLFTTASAFGQDSHIGNLTGNAKKGKDYYRRYCIGCHGVKGDGQGENALYLDPKPRDFTAGTFKCRSTPTGSIPLDVDLFQTIKRGIDTTGMPAWSPLTDQQRADFVAYIKTFSSRFKDEKADAPIVIPPETPNTPESVKRGEVLYQETLKCNQCHGATGVGDGPAAATLRDNKDNPIVPYNFVERTRFKCGDTNVDLYRIFMTGLDGTPMPSFADYLKPDQGWDLVHYLRTLQLNYKPKHGASDEQMAKRKAALRPPYDLANSRD